MKRTLAISMLFLLFTVTATTFAVDVKVAKVEKPDTEIPAFVGWVPDEIVVKFDNAIVSKIDKRTAANGKLGLLALDQLSDRYQVLSVIQQYPGAEPRMYKGREINLSGWHKIKFARQVDVEAAARDYQQVPGVIDAQPIGIHTVTATPNDGYFSNQYHLHQSNDHDMDAPEAWNIETGNSNIIVGILDTGVRYFHKDLGGSNASYDNPQNANGNMWINTDEIRDNGVDDDGNGYVDDWIGWDFVDGADNPYPGEDGNTQDNDPRDFNGHGTHCAGNVAAINNNGYATASPAGGWNDGSNHPTANGVKVMALRIGWSSRLFIFEVGYVRMDFAANAFYYAANNGARITSCSWGSSNSGGLADALDYFLASGGLVFKAAGNDGSESADYMGSRTDIINVAATDANDCKASFSNFGTWVDISAAGVGVYSLYHDHNDPQNDYIASMDGTSMATPLAAGVAAGIWSHDTGMSASEVKQRLFDTADNIYAESCNSSYNNKLGAGRVNLYNGVNFNVGPTAPAAPGNLVATAISDTRIDLTWNDNSNNEDGFKIERKTGTGSFSEIATVGANVTSYSNTGLTPSTTYTYRVRAYNSVGNSNYSNEASATTQSTPQPPAAPSNLVATTMSDTRIDLTWNDNSNNEDGFKIERKTGTGSFSEIATVGANVTSYSNTGLTPSTSYTYRVRAYNSIGNSDYSNEASATTQSTPQPPAAPSNLTATAVSSSQINLEWTDNANNEDGFKIERKTGSGSFSEIANVAANVTNYSNTGLSSNTTYTYRVRAYNNAGNSNYSNEASATTQTSQNIMHVQAVDVTKESMFRKTRGKAMVRIVDASGAAVASATVSGQWSGGASDSDQFTTGSDGWGTAYSNWYRGDANFTFCVTNVTKTNWTYDKNANEETCGSTSGAGALAKANMELEETEGEILANNYPNPFNPTTAISFYLKEAGHVNLEIYNVLGEKVITLLDENIEAGVNSVTWNALNDKGERVGSGFYFYRITIDNKNTLIKKMLLLK